MLKIPDYTVRILRYQAVLVLLFTSMIGNAQATTDHREIRTLHAIHTHNGSILKGEITGWTPDVVTVTLATGVEIPVRSSEIDKIISYDDPGAGKMRKSVRREYQFKDKGLYNVSTVSMSAGPVGGLGLNHAVGYRLSRLLGLGAGVGIESFDLGSGNQIIPFYAEVRGYFLKQHISPYYVLRGGYGVGVKNGESNILEAKGGRMLGAELGYRFGGGRAINFFAGIGVHFQKAEYKYGWGREENFTDKLNYRRTELRMGVIF